MSGEEDLSQAAAPARRGRLRRADCAGPGIRRRRRGRGFSYEDGSGTAIGDEETLERIRQLAIPPAWKDVWICPDPFGHIQATGYDEAGRKQYLYHERWRQRQAARKFEQVREFALALPKLRRAVAADLRRQGCRRERALACAVRLLDLGFFRVGSEVYAEENESFGLATVRREHVTIKPARSSSTSPPRAASGGCSRSAMPPRGGRSRRCAAAAAGPKTSSPTATEANGVDVRSEEINDYIHEKIGDEFTAKDFRTWHGTVLAAVALAGEERPHSEAAAKRAIVRAVDQVSEALGNTPAVCRASYIDPRVLDRFRDGTTIRPAASGNGRLTAKQRLKIEREVIALVS